ncbi:MAG TPA: YhjD/YihY/BrkB family envelope integrity protein [Phycisphaerales bacterium]|nr:YhjD/YihY/BrkB family envelope integrity protein [Phycisphaerales bacterium]HMP38348.1 YhjD/YihY/BrkB family envelope integrity protein [Phycisphaerales bacterium]
MSFIRRTAETIQRILTRPGDELTRWQRALRWWYDYCRHGFRQLGEDDAISLAAALAYRTLFSLLPVLVVVTLTAKAFFGNRLNEVASWVIKLLGAEDVQISSGGESVLLSSWLEEMVGKAQEVNLAGLGWIGAMILIYSAISLMVTIENSFNRIARAPHGRPWHKRVPLYWFVLTVGPILLGLTPWLEARYAAAVASIGSWQWLFAIAKFAWNLVIIWAFIFALYFLVPNAPMRVRPALAGALVAAILLELGKRFLGAYFQSLASSPVYGSLGLVPLFMFWVYLMWIAVLLGLELTSIAQNLHGRQMEEVRRLRGRGELVDPASVLLVMQAVAGRFAQGKSAEAATLAEATGLPVGAVERMLDRLVERGLLHRVGEDHDEVTLARPADSIGADELIRVGWELADDAGGPRDVPLVGRLREAQASLASGSTLASLGR